MRISRFKYLKNIGKINGPNIGKYETIILDVLEESFGYTILRQHYIDGYFLDGYCPMLNLAIEVDEQYHNTYKDKDQLRQSNIQNILSCKFLRIPVDMRGVFDA